jgi:hypothetical protein
VWYMMKKNIGTHHAAGLAKKYGKNMVAGDY